MINQIQEDTGAEIAIEDDGTVFISSEGGEAAKKAKSIIDSIANPHVPEAGETYNGKVVKTTSFGAFREPHPRHRRPAAHLPDPQPGQRRAY